MALQAKDYDLRQTLVPFVASVLHYGAQREHRPGGGEIPAGHPEVYYEDEIEALRQIMSQGVLWQLCKTCHGWDRRALLAGETAWASMATHQRLWEANRELTLCFGEDAVRLCEELYNVLARRSARDRGGQESKSARAEALKQLKALKLAHSGEQQLLYWMMDGLWRDLDPGLPSARYRGRSHWNAWLSYCVATHPLLALRFGPWRSEVTMDRAAVRALIDGPLRQVLPWWLTHGLLNWQTFEPYIWQEKEPAQFVARRERQIRLWEGWIAEIEASGWYHLLVPFLDHLRSCYRALVRDCLEPGYALTVSPPASVWSEPEVDALQVVERALALVNSVYQGRRTEERQHIRDSWARYVGLGTTLEKLYTKVRSVHPADRDAHQSWLIDWWSREDNASLLTDLRKISRGIEGRLG